MCIASRRLAIHMFSLLKIDFGLQKVGVDAYGGGYGLGEGFPGVAGVIYGGVDVGIEGAVCPAGKRQFFDAHGVVLWVDGLIIHAQRYSIERFINKQN